MRHTIENLACIVGNLPSLSQSVSNKALCGRGYDSVLHPESHNRSNPAAVYPSRTTAGRSLEPIQLDCLFFKYICTLA